MTDQSNTPEALLRELSREAADVLADGQVTFGEVVRLGGSLAGKANRFAQISGQQKQALVLQAVDVALKQVLALKMSTLPEDQKEAFQSKIEKAASFAKETLPAVLDVAVQAARGQLDLRKPEVRKTLWQTLKALLGCCGIQAPALPTPVQEMLEGPKEPVKSQSVELTETISTPPQTSEPQSTEAPPASTATA